MKDLFPLIQKSFDIVILKLDLVEVSDVQEICIFLAFLKPSKEQYKYLSSLELRTMVACQFFFDERYFSLEVVWQYFLESNRKFDVQTIESFGVVEQLIVGVSLNLSYPSEGSVRVT
jgi:hypothetical protein